MRRESETKSPRGIGSLVKVLEAVPDRRSRRGRRHPLSAVLSLIAVGTLCDCPHQDAIAQWGRLLSRRMVRDLGFTRRLTPCAATLHNVLKGLDVAAFEAVLREWSAQLERDDRAEIRAIAIDGKTARGSAGKEIPAVHVLSAFDVAQGVLLASAEVGAKTNEAKRAEPFLASLDIEGAVVTGDAAFTQKPICGQILGQKGEFLFVVKDNQPSLKEAIETAFTPPDSPL